LGDERRCHTSAQAQSSPGFAQFYPVIQHGADYTPTSWKSKSHVSNP
jgi:hypothetical protein